MTNDRARYGAAVLLTAITLPYLSKGGWRDFLR
jgi:hypothetical protein